MTPSVHGGIICLLRRVWLPFTLYFSEGQVLQYSIASLLKDIVGFILYHAFCIIMKYGMVLGACWKLDGHVNLAHGNRVASIS